MRAKIPIVAFLALGLTACACTRPAPEPAAEEQAHPLVGTWVWQQTAGGKTGASVSPKTEGYQLEATFAGDGTFAFRKDGESWQTGTWQVQDSESGPIVMYTLEGGPATGASLRWSALGDPPRHLYRFDAAGALVLDEGCCDRYQHVFNRAQ